MRTHNTEAAQQDTPSLVSDPLSSSISECTMSLKREKISKTNANFAHKSFIEIKFSHGIDAKKTSSSIEGANGGAEDVYELKRIVAAPSEFRLFGKIACDFLSCDKHLFSGVTKRVSLRRFPINFFVLSEHRDKHYQVQITKANL